MSLTATAVALMLSTAAPTVDTSAPVPVTASGPSDAAAPVPAAPATDAPPAVEPAPAAADPVNPNPAGTPAPSQTDAAVSADPAAAASAEPQEGMDAMQQGSDIIVMHRKPIAGDPFENINVQSFKTVQAVDKAVLEPVAKVYNKGLPRPIRQGLRNFFSNLDEPVVFAAYLLELKPGKAMETAGRFLINSTLGLAGIVDVAKRKPFNLPYRPNGLSDLLGYYGVGPGPYMYLPLIGPTTLRDVIGDTVDNLMVPALVGKPLTDPPVTTTMMLFNQLGERAAFDEEIRDIRDSDDPYATYRTLYLQQRQAEIDALHGRVTPGVTPVYGPGMRTAGGKKKDADAPQQEGAVQAAPATEATPDAAPATSAPETTPAPVTPPEAEAPAAVTP